VYASNNNRYNRTGCIDYYNNLIFTLQLHNIRTKLYITKGGEMDGQEKGGKKEKSRKKEKKVS